MTETGKNTKKKRIEMPLQHGTFKQTEKVKKEKGVQGKLEI